MKDIFYMQKRSLVHFVIALGYLLASCIAPELDPTSSSPAQSAWCGDGICNGPENADRCPRDCDPGNPISSEDFTQAQPLRVIYAIHTHLTGDHYPYSDDSLSSIDPTVATNARLTIEGLASILDRYGVVATWELVYGMAAGLCTYPESQNVLNSLLSSGHEIGTHSHNSSDIIAAYMALEDNCGIEANVTSGFLIDATRPNADPHQVISEDIQIALDMGIHVTTENLSLGSGRDPFGETCTQIGIGNDMAELTGNMLYPWRPDYLNTNICNHNPTGEMVFLDHVSIEWILLDGQSGAPDVLDERHFSQLQSYFDAALAYHEAHPGQGVAVWGFVSHITEYMPGGQGQFGPDSDSLAALDDFLAYLAQYEAQGRIEFVTASQAAGLAYPNQ
jgi:hypothetical protein